MNTNLNMVIITGPENTLTMALINEMANNRANTK